jgi:hypothetical protein
MALQRAEAFSVTRPVTARSRDCVPVSEIPRIQRSLRFDTVEQFDGIDTLPAAVDVVLVVPEHSRELFTDVAIAVLTSRHDSEKTTFDYYRYAVLSGSKTELVPRPSDVNSSRNVVVTPVSSILPDCSTVIRGRVAASNSLLYNNILVK